MTDWDDMVLVGHIARPHGLRGHVVINPETNFVEERFGTGSVLWVRSVNGAEALTVSDVRIQNGRPVVGFEGFASVEAVEHLSGVELRIPEEALHPLGEQQYYEHQLVGCHVRTISGREVGLIARVEGGLGGSRLVIDGPRGEIQIPLAVEICVDIDIEGRTIRINPPEGLLELNETKASRSASKST